MRLALLIISLTMPIGCVSRTSLYERMNQAVTPEDGLQQVQFAHVGHLDTAEGRYEVAVQHLVITGMLAPRGQTHLHIFDVRGRLHMTYPFLSVRPLWCEGGKLYLAGFGDIPGIPIDPALAAQFAPDELPSGNVVDFSRGLDRAVMVCETRYGSSGGIEDTAATSPDDPVDDSLHRAAYEGDLSTVRHLIATGFDVNGRNDHSETPLHMACYGRNLDVARLLLTNGAAVHTDYGADPLHIAVNLDDREMSALLLDAGADPTRLTAEGHSAFDLVVDDDIRSMLSRW